MIRIFQQRAKCIGCNACVEAAPFRWRISRKDGRSTLIGSAEKSGIFTVVTGADEWEENTRAAENCPVRIIEIREK
jgi:ferredoxin